MLCMTDQIIGSCHTIPSRATTPTQAKQPDWSKMPMESWANVHRYLNPKDSLNVLRTCKKWCDRDWKSIYLNHFTDLEMRDKIISWACYYNRAKVVEYFLDMHFDVNRLLTPPRTALASTTVPIPQMMRPLHLALLGGHEQLFFRLLANRADWSALDHDGRTALFYATSPSIVRYLVKMGIDAEHRDNNGATALFVMTTYGLKTPADRLTNRLKIITSLINDAHANVNTEDNFGWNVLTLSVKPMGHPAITDLLLRNGADPNPEPSTLPGSSYISPLSMAACYKNGWLSLVHLIHFGADLNSREPTQVGVFFSPLIRAVINGQLPAMKALLESGADPDMGSDRGNVNNFPSSPMVWAVYRAGKDGHFDSLKLLLEYGANINSPLAEAIYVAVMHSEKSLHSTQVLRFLLEIGANLNGSRSIEGMRVQWDPYDRAIEILTSLAWGRAKSASRSFIKFLIDHGRKGNPANSGLELYRRAMKNSGSSPSGDTYNQCLEILCILMEAKAGRGGFLRPGVYLCDALLYQGRYTEPPEVVQLLLDYNHDHLARLFTSRLGASPLGWFIKMHRASDWDSGCPTKMDIRVAFNALQEDRDIFWEKLCLVLLHPAAGARSTAKFSNGLMAQLFCLTMLRKVKSKQEKMERIEQFAEMTNYKGRWGPDGISGLMDLIYHGAYWYWWAGVPGRKRRRAHIKPLMQGARALMELCNLTHMPQPLHIGKDAEVLWGVVTSPLDHYVVLQGTTKRKPRLSESKSILDHDFPEAFSLLYRNFDMETN